MSARPFDGDRPDRPYHGGFPDDHPEGLRPMTNRDRADLADILPPKDTESISNAAACMFAAEWLEDNPGHLFAGHLDKSPADLRAEARSWRYRANYGGTGMNA